VGLLEEVVQLFVLYDSALKEQLKPENGFVRFFQNDAEFGDELGPRPRPASCPVICPNGRARTENLPSKNSGFLSGRQSSIQMQNTKRKLFGAYLQILTVPHERYSCILVHRESVMDVTVILSFSLLTSAFCLLT
jgi:hypothetical protein